MINEIVEYARSNSIESGFYAALAVYWSYVFYVTGESIYSLLKDKKENIEDKLTEERILSENRNL